MVILWITEAVSYPVSSFFLIISMTLFTAFAPSPASPVDTRKALELSLGGFRSSAWILTVAALFLSAAIQKSGLGQRMGLCILFHLKARPRNIRFGVLLMCLLLTLFIPAQAATAALMTAICLGLIEAFHVDRKSNFSKGMLLIVGFGTTLSGVGVLTSGAASIQAMEFIRQATRYSISWIEWMFYSMPFALVLCLVLFGLVEWLFPVRNEEIPGGRDAILSQIHKLGPLSPNERHLLYIMLCTITLWATGGTLHPLDSSTVALMAVVAMMLPGISVARWRDLVSIVNWGTVMLFGTAISLGQALLSTGAAEWVIHRTLVPLGINEWPFPAVICAAGLFFSLFSLAFSSRSAAASALVPAIIGFAQTLPASSGHSVWGVTLALFYVVDFSLVLPVNSPMSMVAYSSNTFSAREMLMVGIPLCLLSIGILVLFSMTCWRWIGML